MLAEPSKSESSFFFRDAVWEILTDFPSIFLSDLPSEPSSLLLKGLDLLESGRVMTDWARLPELLRFIYIFINHAGPLFELILAGTSMNRRSLNSC